MADSDSACEECGCHCDSCTTYPSVHLRQEIVTLQQQLTDRDKHIEQMETSVFLAAHKFPTGEVASLHDQIAHWQEKYERLLESHKKLQRVNQGLEDKLLKIVDKYESEKVSLNRDVANLTSRLIEARVAVAELEDENDRYREDCYLAVQLLQCKPSNFVAHKLDTLPADLQQKVKHHMNIRKRDQSTHTTPPAPDVRTIRVPISTFPPTAMVYSVNKLGIADKQLPTTDVNKPPVDLVSAAIMAKVLEERAKERRPRPVDCGTCGGYRVVSEEQQQGMWRDTENKATQTVGCQCEGPVKCQCNPPSSRPFPVLVHARGRSDSVCAINMMDQVGPYHPWARSASSSTETEI